MNPTKHTPKSARTLAATFIATGLFAGAADAAITLTIDRFSRNINVSGTYTLLDATATDPAIEHIRIPNGSGGWHWVTDGSGSALSPNLSNTTGVTLNFPSGLFTWSIFDVSNSNASLATGTINSLVLNAGGTFVGFTGATPLSGNRDASTDAGDILEMSGNFTLDVSEAADLANLVEGTHTSTYNGETLTVNIVNVIPEPSSTLLVGLGLLGCAARRRRSHRRGARAT